VKLIEERGVGCQQLFLSIVVQLTEMPSNKVSLLINCIDVSVPSCCCKDTGYTELGL
jgi:hypothetical protein